MSYNSKKFFGGIAISLTAMGALSSQALAQQSWTMTSTWPDSISLVEIDRRWAETVNKLVGDELQINFRAGGTLMPSTEVFDAIETGGIEAAGDSPVYWAGNSPAFSLLGTTLSLFTAVDYLNWIQERGGFELYQEVYGQYGMVYLPHGVVNNEAGFMGRTEIKSLADLDGKRLRISGRDQGGWRYDQQAGVGCLVRRDPGNLKDCRRVQLSLVAITLRDGVHRGNRQILRVWCDY